MPSKEDHRWPDGQELSILVADDDPAMRSLVSDELKEDGYRVFQVADGNAAIECVEQAAPDLVITDLRMPHGGMELVAQLRASAPGMPIILLTAFGDKVTESLAYKWGASAFINKPVRMATLKMTVEHFVGKLTQKKGAGYE